ncbi:MAG: response regulator [Armatimonadetes bacterium]|nr:response regulator [Armatimonadota bacterium]
MLPSIEGGARAGTPVQNGYILLAEDDELFRETLALILAETGYAVLQAADCDQGWDLFRRYPVLAVITDNAMGHGSASLGAGLRLARRVKRQSPGTPVVMLTALPPAAATTVCDAVLTKPAEVEDLLGALQRLGVGTPAAGLPLPAAPIPTGMSAALSSPDGIPQPPGAPGAR